MSNFDIKTFNNPPSIYRGCPFWAWNDKLDKKELLHQIDIFKEIGFGGFYMHPRCGLDTPYLSDEFNDLVKSCVDYAESLGMYANLYDEDRWPSGYGGGFVTKYKEYRQRFLVLTYESLDTNPVFVNNKLLSGRVLLKQFNLTIKNQTIVDDLNGDTLYNLYLCIADESPSYNNQTYVDVLSIDAMNKFAEITYGNYEKFLKDKFGTTIKNIFTDEPQFKPFKLYKKPNNKYIGIIAWTDDFNDTFIKEYRYSLIDNVPYIFFNNNSSIYPKSRLDYFNHVTKRFKEAYSLNLGSKAKKLNLNLTGHLMEEPKLITQQRVVGEAMAHYSGFGVPGLDLLCGKHEFTTIKQVSSICHQLGKEDILCESYGVSRYAVEFSKYIEETSWLSCLGVTQFVPHLSLYSLKGESKRDYPPSLSYQTPWYKEFKIIEDFSSRLNYLLKQGKRIIKLGVIHPIESYFLSQDKNIDKEFLNLANILLYNHIDFDYISESMLEELVSKDNLNIGKCHYDAILIPSLVTIRKTTLDYLYKYSKTNKVYYLNKPSYIDGIKSNVDYSNFINLKYDEIINKLSYLKDYDITSNGKTLPNYISTILQDDKSKWLFITNTYKNCYVDECTPLKHITKVDNNILDITINGIYNVSRYNLFNANISQLDVKHINNKTIVNINSYNNDPIMLHLDNNLNDNSSEQSIIECSKPIKFKNKVKYSLDNENCLLLDKASFIVNNKESKKDIIYKLSDTLRKYLHMDSYKSNLTRWISPKSNSNQSIKLKFNVISKIDISCELVSESSIQSIDINNNLYNINSNDYYLDKSFKKYPINLSKGLNIITIEQTFIDNDRLENIFIIGNFGVYKRFNTFYIDKLKDYIKYKDLTYQGLPFYTGKVTYHNDINCLGENLKVFINNYASALLELNFNNSIKNYIYKSPFTTFFKVNNNLNKLDITTFISSENSLGAVHVKYKYKLSDSPKWFNMKDIKKSNNNYYLDKIGILSKPKIYSDK